MSERFYVNCPLSVGMINVTGPEAHHMAVVCRVRPGDPVVLFNGDGHEYPGRVVDVSKRDVGVELDNILSPQREIPYVLHIAVPLPKGDRAQFLVEKLTELGANRLSLLLTARSVITPGEAKMEKLQRYVIEASKQCRRNVLMQIDPPCKWSDFVRDTSLPGRRLVAHPDGERLTEAQEDVVVAVGPEGGFTDEELALAVQAGWHTIALGPRILRVETAALVLASRLGDSA